MNTSDKEATNTLALAQALLDASPTTIKAEGKANMRSYCDICVQHLKQVHKPGVGKLIIELRAFQRSLERA
jgi:hypothetical protein